MARIAPIEPTDADPQAREELDRQLAANGRLTNMKRILIESGEDPDTLALDDREQVVVDYLQPYRRGDV